MEEAKAPANKQRPTIDFKFTLEEMADDVGTFTGYASVWGIVDSYGDVVQPGAFKRTIKNRKGKGFPMLWSHKVDEPIGMIFPEEDDKGLKVKGVYNMDDPLAVRIRSHMKQGSVTGLSIGYQTVVEELDKESGTRKLKEIKLWEISPVVFPACEPAQADSGSVKSADETDPKLVECSATLTDPDPAKATLADDSAERHSFVVHERARLLKHYLTWRS